MVEIFQLQLHKSSAVPLYQQLAEGIEGMITDGVLLANSKLPPIRKTAEHFGVNSVTIVNAYKLRKSSWSIRAWAAAPLFRPCLWSIFRSLWQAAISVPLKAVFPWKMPSILQAPLCRMKCSLWMRLRRRSMRCWIGKRAEPSAIWTAWAMSPCASSFAVIL